MDRWMDTLPSLWRKSAFSLHMETTENSDMGLQRTWNSKCRTVREPHWHGSCTETIYEQRMSMKKENLNDIDRFCLCLCFRGESLERV